MLTFEDLYVARLVREQKLVPADVLPALFAELDSAPGTPGLASRLLERKLVDADAMRAIVGNARRRVGLEADQVYTEIALEKHKLSLERLDALMTQTTTGGRIGGKLVAEGLLTAEQDAQVIAVARAKLQAREKELREKERTLLDQEVLSEPTIHIETRKKTTKIKVESSGAIKAQEEAILSEPTLHLRKDELATPVPEKPLDLADAEDTVRHDGVLPLPSSSGESDGPRPIDDDPTEKKAKKVGDAEATERHESILPLPGQVVKGLKKGKKESLAGKTLKVLSGYEIEKELGRGAMGVVYLAREVQLKRQVALKVLPKGESEAAEQRFMREARAIAALDHPGIVPVYQYGEADGEYYIAMKCIDGRPLKQIAQKPLQPKRAAAIMEQVARAMHYAHEQGVVHRDLKPANILVEAGDKPWVVDFGIAKLDTEMTMTQAGEIMGTPAYMSPEQALQMPIDSRSDIYSIGAVLYAIVSGQPPFPGQNAIEVLPRVATEDPKKPTELRPDVPRDLETIILVAMMKEPERRYGTALDLAEDLRRFGAGEPISGQRPGAVYKARRWMRRHKLPIALLLVALLAAGAANAWRGSKADADKAKTEKEQKEKQRQRVKERLDAIDVAYAEAKKAATTEEVIAGMKKLNEAVEAASAVAPGNERVAGWRADVDKLVHEKAEARRAAAKKCFEEGSGERALATLKDAIALEPGSPDNKALEDLFNRPVVAIRFKHPGTQLVWAKLDAEMHLASDWQPPQEKTAERATFSANETRWVRIKCAAPGRMEMILDLEVKPGSVLDLPPMPLETADTKSMVFVAPVPHVFGGRAKGATRGTPEQRPIAAFLIDRTEVTRNAFARFVKARGYERKELWSERGRQWLEERRAAGPLAGPKDCDLSETGRGEEPVTGISFFEAEAYATFIGKQIPTQDQFEAAARGELGGTYPWGNRFAKELFQLPQPTPRPVGTAPLDMSAAGCLDLAGNVREWTSEAKKDWASEQSGQSLHLVKGAFVGDAEADALQLAKGAACTARDPRERAADIGFRCVKNLKTTDY